MTNSLFNTPLSDDDYALLDTLLGAPEFGGRAMDVSTLEGFLTAIATGPNLIPPSQWLPWVWDKEEGEAGPVFADPEQARRAIELVMRHYQHMTTWLLEDPASFDPIFTCGAPWGAAQWCEGFLLGTTLDPQWTALFVSEPAWFAPFMLSLIHI